ncbi:MAG: ADP-ribosylglycohydrolase family protein [Nitrospirota bacterium]|nr:ADP-ribosylglycohydrolase family protein [Nitrospirota bacterium]
MERKLSKFKGCLVGLAVGDSLGARRQGAAGAEAADLAPRYSDDTVLSLGVAESLADLGEFHYWHMTENLIRYYEQEPWRRYGNTVSRVFRMMRNGRLGFGMLDRDIFPEGSYGNGAVVRVSPVGLLYHDDPRTLRDIAYHCASITHSHELALEGAVVHACAIALSVLSESGEIIPSEFLALLRLITNSPPYQEKLKLVFRFLEEGCSKKDVVEQLGNGGSALNSVPTAIYTVLANKDFKSALLNAAELGGTTDDTLCAMTGAIAGARYGIEGIPSQWQETVENGERTERIAKRLWETKASGKECPSS